MKKIIIIFLVSLLFTGCSTTKQKTDAELMAEGWVKVSELPSPIDTTKTYKDSDGNEHPCEAGSYSAACSSVSAENLIDYLGRDDVLYIDVRDFNDYAKKHLRNFEVIPYFALIFDAEAGSDETKPQLFGGSVTDPTQTYNESLELLEALFPKDQTIFLMCQSGGRVVQLMRLLEANGWDMSKIYNVGGMGQYTDSVYAPYTTDTAEITLDGTYSFEGLTK